MTRAWRNWIAPIALVLGIIAALALIYTPRADADTAEPAIVAITLNVHGGGDRKGGGNHGAVTPVLRDVINLVDTQRPDVLGLQELCRVQDRAIRAQLKKRGYVGTMSHLAKDVSCGKDRVSGIALYVKTPKLTSRKRTNLPWGQNPVGSTGRQQRALLCANAKIHGQTWRACVTHLSPGDPDRRNQISKVARTVAPYDRLVLVGDFNASSGGIRAWFGDLHHDGSGIDWVVSTNPTDATAVLPIPSSDHPAVVADVTKEN